MSVATTIKTRARTGKQTIPLPQIISEYAEIGDYADGYWHVHCSDGKFKARKAFSCLVHPIVGDKVLISRDADEECYILAIMERSGKQNASLVFHGNVQISAPQGQIDVLAKERLGLVTTNQIEMSTSQLNVTALNATLNTERSQITSQEIMTTAKVIRVLAEKLDTFADRFVLRAKNSFRWVDELDQLKAGEVIHHIRTIFSVHSSGHATLTAKGDVRIDGERIHMG
ncbi:MAG: DUF3540 domain-containing protein [SAR324 cluster bacterium]|nr:DUF3540 domain-containing protein [SAR324 cluster bacterium]